MRKFFGNIIGSLLAFAIVFCTGFYFGNHWQGPIRKADPIVIQQLVEGKMNQIAELTAMEYRYTNTAGFSDHYKFKEFDIPLTGKHFILKYDGIVRAGINLDQVRVSVADEVITVVLPDAKILSHEIREDSIAVLDESKNIFNQIQVEDYASFQTEQKRICEEQIVNDGLLVQAKEHAADTIRGFLSASDEFQKYTIIVE